ncbi:MAG: rhomboid family intramembrane serine protease [Planctomycetota bacterium]
MFGAADDLRCPNCAQRRRNKYVAPRAVVRQDYLPVTLTIVSLAVGATLLNWVFPDWGEYLISFRSAVWNGEIWRLGTTTLVHAGFSTGGILHIAFNLYWFWRFGGPLESWMGSGRFLGYFLLLAFGPMAAQFLASGQPAVGLSGVVYGMFGTLFALRRYKDFAAEILQPATVQMLVIWFVICIFLTRGGMMSVANVAHGGGAVLGYLLGRAVLMPQRKVLIAGISALVVVLSLLTQWMPWNEAFQRRNLDPMQVILQQVEQARQQPWDGQD